jgi:DNA-binding NtrC family response regulator
MNRSLLIVEDDPDQLEVLARCFVQAGYHVVGVHHPRQALEAASFRQFQVALLAASLPEMDGLELMRCLKRTQDRLQFVILAGGRYPEQQARAEGTAARLVNPWNIAILEETVEDAFEQSVHELPA